MTAGPGTDTAGAILADLAAATRRMRATATLARLAQQHPAWAWHIERWIDGEHPVYCGQRPGDGLCLVMSQSEEKLDALLAAGRP